MKLWVFRTSMEGQPFIFAIDGSWLHHFNLAHPLPTAKSAMQASSNAIIQEDNLIEEPEQEDYDMDVELGVNLVDAFTKKHVNVNGQATLTPSPIYRTGILCPPATDIDSGVLLPAEVFKDGDRSSALGLELDDVAQEILSKALVEDKEGMSMEIDSTMMPSKDLSLSHKLEMVVYLYAFEKFRIVYA